MSIDKLTERKHWKEAISWIFWNVLWGLSPVWLGFILFLAIYQKPSISTFSSNGEFLIYSAAMLAMSLYIVLKEYKISKFPFRRLFGLVCVLCLLIVILLFSTLTLTALISKKIEMQIDRDFVRYVSYATYVVAVLVAFILTALDDIRTYADIKGESKAGIVKLEKDFDSLGEE